MRLRVASVKKMDDFQVKSTIPAFLFAAAVCAAILLHYKHSGIMFVHYLKMAVRNLRKFALQNTVSIIGLAAGFIALSLSSLWVNYEDSYDTFHKDYDRIWSTYYRENGTGLKGMVAKRDFDSEGIIQGKVYNQFLEHPDEWPELEGATIFYLHKATDKEPAALQFDESFFDIFSVDVIAGSLESLYDYEHIGISDEFARSLFGDEDPIGMEYDGCTICAVFKKWKHSYMSFDVIRYFPLRNFTGQHDDACYPMFLKVRPGTDPDALIRRIHGTRGTGTEEWLSNYHVFDVSQAHNIMDYDLASLNIRNLKTFRTASILLVLCAVTNWLLLFLTGLGSRRRELALRKASGSRNGGLLALLSVEAALYLLIASVIGVIVLAMLYRLFTGYAGIGLDGVHFMVMGAAWLGALLLVSLVIAIGAIAVNRRTQLRRQMEAGHRHVMRKLSLFVQIAVSVMLAFCALVMVRQMAFMNRQDWGFRIKNIVRIYPNVISAYYKIEDGTQSVMHYTDIEEQVPGELLQQLRSFAGVQDVLLDRGSFIEGPESDDVVNFINITPTPDYNDMNHWITATKVSGMTKVASPVLGLTVLEGQLPEDGIRPGQVVLTENTCNALGLEKPYAGQTIYTPNYDGSRGFKPLTVEAVVADIYSQGPTQEPHCYAFDNTINDIFSNRIVVTVMYADGMRHQMEKQLNEIPQIADGDWKVVFNEDEFARLTASERNLMNMLVLLSVLCVLIAVFGVYSIVTLTCQERRREIAVRKIHGAGIRDILGIFVREYGLLLVLASALAFAVGYMIVHVWVAQFQRQAPISWWLYAAVFAGMVLIISLTVAHRVLVTARENPADVIKSE